MKPYDLTVAYRIYPRISKRPPIHSEDKFALARLCLASFQRSLGNLSAKMIVLLDGCPPQYEALFLDHFEPEDVEFIRLPQVGNAETFFQQMAVLKNQRFSESIFFLEDDYFFLPNQIPQMIDFKKNQPDADFISPYDHLDYYTYQLHAGRQELRRHGGRHWRSAISNTCTFLTTRSVLDEVWNVFLKYPRIGDLGIFLGVTSSAGDVIRLIRRLGSTEERWLLPILHRSLRTCFRQLLFKKKFRLWYPIPSMATHMDVPFLAPGIAWQTEFGNLSSQLKAESSVPMNFSRERRDLIVS